jgi:Tol biopolymer transport system component
MLTYHRYGNVYTLSLDSMAERKLTSYSPADAAEYVARSPDGARLALVRPDTEGRALFVMDDDRRESRIILRESSRYTQLQRLQWLPMSATILYTVHQYLMEGAAMKGETFRAEQIDVDGSNRRTIASDARDATLAADGTLAFVRGSAAGDELVLLMVDGTERVLVPDRSFQSLAAPRFSPDGQRIAFTAVGTGFQSKQQPGGAGLRLGPTIAYAHGLPWDVWLADLSGGLKLVNMIAEDDPTLAWSPDAQYLAVSGGNGVHIVDVATGTASQVASMGGFGGIDWTP